MGIDFKTNTEEDDFAKKMKEDIYKKMNGEQNDFNANLKEDEIKEKTVTE